MPSKNSNETNFADVMDPVEETKELAADPVVEAAADEEAADEAPVETAPPAPPAALADEAAA